MSEVDAGRVDPETASRMESLEHYVLDRTLPIVGAKDDQRAVYGTATLFVADDRGYLITAKHVYDKVRHHTDQHGVDFAVPAAASGGPALALGHCRIQPVETEGLDLDVAVIALDSDEVVADLTRGWQSIGPDAVKKPAPNAEHYYVGGYPGVYGEQEGLDFATGMAVVVASEYVPNPHYPAYTSAATHLFLNHEQQGHLYDGTTVESPELPGISGSTVWSLDLEAGGATPWTAERALSAVAVETAYLRGTYIRSTRWSAAAHGLRSFDEAVGKEMEERLQ